MKKADVFKSKSLANPQCQAIALEGFHSQEDDNADYLKQVLNNLKDNYTLTHFDFDKAIVINRNQVTQILKQLCVSNYTLQEIKCSSGKAVDVDFQTAFRGIQARNQAFHDYLFTCVKKHDTKGLAAALNTTDAVDKFNKHLKKVINKGKLTAIGASLKRSWGSMTRPMMDLTVISKDGQTIEAYADAQREKHEEFNKKKQGSKAYNACKAVVDTLTDYKTQMEQKKSALEKEKTIKNVKKALSLESSTKSLSMPDMPIRSNGPPI